MRELRLIPVIVVVILGSTLAVIAFVALFPYLDLIGKMLIGLCAVAVGCVIVVAGGEAYHHLAIRSLERKHFSLKTEGVAAVVSNGTMRNLSAEVEEARRPLQIAAPAVTVEPVDKDGLTPSQLKDIRDLFDEGNSIRTIADSLGIKTHIIQKITQPWRIGGRVTANSEQKP